MRYCVTLRTPTVLGSHWQVGSQPICVPKPHTHTHMLFDVAIGEQVKQSFQRFTLWMALMTYMHFRMKNVSFIMYWVRP